VTSCLCGHGESCEKCSAYPTVGRAVLDLRGEMSILDRYPPPWTEGIGGDVASQNRPVISVDGYVEYGDVFRTGKDSDDVKRLILAAPRLLRALANIVVMVDGPEPARRAAIEDAKNLIAEIEGDDGNA